MQRATHKWEDGSGEQKRLDSPLSTACILANHPHQLLLLSMAFPWDYSVGTEQNTAKELQQYHQFHNIISECI